jgi:hypothetical protein
MAVFFDPHEHNPRTGFREALRNEKTNIQEWNIYTNLHTVLNYIESVGVRFSAPLGSPSPAQVEPGGQKTALLADF